MTMQVPNIVTMLRSAEGPATLAPNHPKPSVGRVVHYQSYGTPGGEYLPEPRAAIITAIAPAEVPGATAQFGLAILNPTGLFFNPDVPFAETPTPGCWNWPPRV